MHLPYIQGPNGPEDPDCNTRQNITAVTARVAPGGGALWQEDDQGGDVVDRLLCALAALLQFSFMQFSVQLSSVGFGLEEEERRRRVNQR